LIVADFAHNEAVDVVVIGTGAGGGNVIRELCLNGVKVVALEAGARLDPDTDYEPDEWTMFNKMAWLDTVVAEGDTPGLATWICKTVGGTTVHWAGAALRFQPHEFRCREEYSTVDGASLMNWPITLDDVMPFYEEAEKRLGVTGRVAPPTPPNTNFLVLKRGADALGLHAHPGHMALNAAAEYDGRPMCDQRGYCFQGCTNRAMWSSLYEAIPKAEATGRLDLRPNAQAIRIETNGNGRVTSVVYARPDGSVEEQKARAVVVSGNSIQTPRLLLNSTSAQFPDGLANGSGEVGRNYMRHLTASSYALFERPVHAYRGITMMGIIEDFADHKPEDRGFAGGFHLETIMLGPAFSSVFVSPGPPTSTPDSVGLWGEPLVELMDNYTHLAGLWIVGEDMPQSDNRVTLHPTQKDAAGVPVPVVTFRDHPNDIAMREFAWARARELYEAAGAVKCYDTPPYPSTHNLGTCRMGSDPSSSVLNEWCQSHEVPNLFVADGSVFTTGAAENPTLTISALGIRTAHYIVEQMKEGAI
jgi:choline dehydrogenase-like flavoprotein